MTTTQTTNSTWQRRRPAIAVLATLAVLGAAGAVAFWPGGDTEEVQADGGTTVTTAAPAKDPGTDPVTDPVAPPAKGVDLGSVNWNAVKYPIDCGSTGTKVLDKSFTTPSAGHHVSLLMVACDAGAGSPPRSIFVYDSATSATEPHLLQTLSSDGMSRLTKSFKVNGAGVVATGSSYSGDSVPRCCPDGTFTSRWTWSGTTYSLAS